MIATVIPFVLGGAVHAAPNAILFLSSAPTVRDVFAADAPHLQALLRTSCGAMTAGPIGTDGPGTLMANGYVRRLPDSSSDSDAAWLMTNLRAYSSDSDLLIINPHGAEAGGFKGLDVLKATSAEDQVLAVAEKQHPKAVIIALFPDAASVATAPGESGLQVPSWIAVSSLRGVLTSDTTRTPGIVSNLDVAPTLAAIITGKLAPGTVGHVVRETPGDGVTETQRWQDGLHTIGNATMPVNSLIALATAGTLFVGLWLASRSRVHPRARTAVQAALIACAVAPVAAGLAAAGLPVAASAFWLSLVLLIAVMTAVVCWAGQWLSHSREDAPVATLQLMMMGVIAFVLADLAKHGIALRASPLTSFYLTGVRFYGLGNEYTALVIPAGLFTGLLSLQRTEVDKLGRYEALGLGVWFTALLLLIGWPSLGADLGGVLAAGVCYGVAWTVSARRSGMRFAPVFAFMAVAACVAAIVWSDLHSSHATHVAHFVQAAGHGSGGPIAMIRNKLGMNYRLLIAPAAVVSYVVAALFGWVWMTRLQAVRKRLARQYPWLQPAVPALIAGGFAAFALNDTGIVMLGLMAFAAGIPAVYLALEPAGLRVLS